MDLISKIFVKFFATKVGCDEFGNQYFEAKKTNKNNPKKKRYVIYNGIAEPSKVPASWHCWLHYAMDQIPNNCQNFSWQKVHLPNLTNTKYAYFPLGDKRNKSQRQKISSDYQSWKPSN